MTGPGTQAGECVCLSNVCPVSMKEAFLWGQISSEGMTFPAGEAQLSEGS